MESTQGSAAFASGPDNPSSRRAGQSPFVYLGVLIVTFVLADFGGLLSAFLSGHGWPSHHMPSLVALWSHASDPSAAWHVPVGPVGFYWLITVFVIAVAIGGPWYLFTRFEDRKRDRSDDAARVEGLATARDVRLAAGKRQLLAHAPVLRPTLRDPEVGDLGLNLGASRRVRVYFSVEDSMIIVGPPRSGKGLFLAVNAILDAPGPVITTSTRPDNLAVTLAARSARGRVGVVDLEQLANGVPSTLRWSPIHGCEFPQTAINRAAALCVGAADGIDGGSFWLQQAIAVVRCLLRAAALDHRTVADLARWSVSPNAALDAVAILTESPGEVPNWAWELDAIIAKDPRQRDGVWSLVANVFAPLANPDVIRQLSPAPGEEFIADDFLREDGTLYLLATSSGASATANFIGALIEDVVAAARRLAAASPGARLERPLTLVLDELASFPIESVKSLMNDGGGSGIATIGIVQSLSQMRDIWGHDGAAALWNSATYKIVLGGSSSVDDLRDLVALSGERESDTSVRRPILELSMIRTLKEGQALLLLRRARPMVLALRPWTDRKDASRLRQAKQKVEEMLRQGAIAKRADRD